MSSFVSASSGTSHSAFVDAGTCGVYVNVGTRGNPCFPPHLTPPSLSLSLLVFEQGACGALFCSVALSCWRGEHQSPRGCCCCCCCLGADARLGHTRSRCTLILCLTPPQLPPLHPPLDGSAPSCTAALRSSGLDLSSSKR